MDMNSLRQELRLRLTGGVIDLELQDSALDGCIVSALRQMQRYYDSTILMTIPYKSCIDLKDLPIPVSSVSRVFRTEGYMGSNASNNISNGESSSYDPMYLASWQMMSGSGQGLSTLSNWVSSLGAYNTALQIRNTLSTDLVFRYDRYQNQLYVNCSYDFPKAITIEYVPILQSIENVVSDFWIDIAVRLSLAICKQVIGRIRKKFTQSNALWQLDTDILTEGLEEEKELQELMRKASQLAYPID